MTSEAQKIFKSLRGLVCTYKPPGCSVDYISAKLKINICADLNRLDTTPPRIFQELQYSGGDVLVKGRPSYADNVLCSGPKFKSEKLKVTCCSKLSDLMSGVLVLAINPTKNLRRKLEKLSFTKCFHIKGVLGQTTTNFHIDNRVLARARYDNVNREKFEKILASYQSVTQRKMFEEYGFFLTSQEAYDFAVNGLYRPEVNVQPVIYSMKLIDFQPPNFTIEVQCIHPKETYLLHLIHNLGLNLKCYATCVSIRCIRYGCFHVQHALVKEQWNLKEISENMLLCRDIFRKLKISSTVETVKNPTVSTDSTAIETVKTETISARVS